MRAVLLAAGMGRRLAPASGGIAKARAVVAGQPLVVHQLRTLQGAGFSQDRIVVVGGCDYERVGPLVAREAPNATLVRNDAFHHQNLLSLLSARELLAEGFLLVNVDHLMPWAIHRRMVEHPADVVAATDQDRPVGADDMKVRLDASGRIAAISKQLDTWDRGYIGMTRVRAAAVTSYLETADAVLADIGPERSVVEMVLARIQPPPAVCDCSGFKWAEVDTPDELAAAEALLASLPRFFHQNARFFPQDS